MKNVTITLDPDSPAGPGILEREMRQTTAYWKAYEDWKKLPGDLGGEIDASKRFTREEAHARR